MNSPGIMFWCGISKEKLIGPYEVEDGTVTKESYRQLLIRKMFPRPASLRSDLVFQKDGSRLTNLSEYEGTMIRSTTFIGLTGKAQLTGRSFSGLNALRLLLLGTH